MDGYTDVLGIDELSDGHMTAVEVDGKKLLIANAGGEFYAADEHCPHMHANLVKGTLEGTVLTCPLHHSQFDLTDGSVVRWTDFSGALKTVGDKVRHPRPLTTYDVRVDGGRILVGSAKT